MAPRLRQPSGGLGNKFGIQRFASYGLLPSVCARYWLRVLSHEAANVDTPPTREPTNPEVAEIIAESMFRVSTLVRR